MKIPLAVKYLVAKCSESARISIIKDFKRVYRRTKRRFLKWANFPAVYYWPDSLGTISYRQGRVRCQYSRAIRNHYRQHVVNEIKQRYRRYRYAEISLGLTLLPPVYICVDRLRSRKTAPLAGACFSSGFGCYTIYFSRPWFCTRIYIHEMAHWLVYRLGMKDSYHGWVEAFL